MLSIIDFAMLKILNRIICYSTLNNFGYKLYFLCINEYYFAIRSLLYVAAILFAIGNGLMWPSFMSILSNRARTIQQGSVQGTAGSFGGLASIIGLTIGGLLYTLVGATTFLISASVIFAVFVMSFRLLKMK
jgi:MFS family permease